MMENEDLAKNQGWSDTEDRDSDLVGFLLKLDNAETNPEAQNSVPGWEENLEEPG